MNKVRIFSGMLFNNNDVIETRKFSLLITLFLFISTSFTIAFPMLISRTFVDPSEIASKFPDINQVFETLYEEEIPCKIGDDYLLKCSTTMENRKIGEYDIVFSGEENTDHSRVVFNENTLDIYLVTSSKTTDQHVSGDYRYINGFDFSKVKSQQTSGMSKEEYYQNVTETFIHSVNQSYATSHIALILMFQIVQFGIFSGILAFLMRFSNKRRNYKLTFLDSFKIVVFAAVSPAIFVALIAFINPQFASILFNIIYTIRIVFIYMKRLKQIDYKDPEDENNNLEHLPL